MGRRIAHPCLVCEPVEECVDAVARRKREPVDRHAVRHSALGRRRSSGGSIVKPAPASARRHAPSSASRTLARSPAARVTSTRLPNSGNASNQRICVAQAHDVADDQHGRRYDPLARGIAGDRRERCRRPCAGRARAILHDRCRRVRRESVARQLRARSHPGAWRPSETRACDAGRRASPSRASSSALADLRVRSQS